MKVKDLTTDTGRPLYAWVLARIECEGATKEELEFWERDVSKGDLLPLEILLDGTIRDVLITGNSGTSWRIVETPPGQTRPQIDPNPFDP